MDPQAQMMAAALMGGQNSMQPSAMGNYQQQMPDMMNSMQPSQTQQQPQMPQQGGAGMFSMPYGAQAQMNMQPQNMMM